MVSQRGKSITFSSKKKQKSLIPFPYHQTHEEKQQTKEQKHSHKEKEQHNPQTTCPITLTAHYLAAYKYTSLKYLCRFKDETQSYGKY